MERPCSACSSACLEMSKASSSRCTEGPSSSNGGLASSIDKDVIPRTENFSRERKSWARPASSGNKHENLLHSASIALAVSEVQPPSTKEPTKERILAY